MTWKKEDRVLMGKQLCEGVPAHSSSLQWKFCNAVAGLPTRVERAFARAGWVVACEEWKQRENSISLRLKLPPVLCQNSA